MQTEVLYGNGLRTSYTYDAEGYRDSITEQDKVTNFLYQGGMLLHELDEDKNPAKYNAQIEDDLTGLYYLRARYYNTGIGRFTQEDVIYNDGINTVTQLDEKTKVIFRMDVGKNAHSIEKYGYRNPVNHINIEIQVKASSGKYKTKWDFHMILDNLGKASDSFATGIWTKK